MWTELCKTGPAQVDKDIPWLFVFTPALKEVKGFTVMSLPW